jgi:uncharacterized protein (DUF362 family)/Pyruvate/2-oxoacid:ferredoxin oxidoreductase delta subunit
VKSTVSSIAIDSYDRNKLSAALVGLLSPLGGLSRFVRPGMKVLLKPNLLSARTPDRAVTTHPELVWAVADACRRLDATVFIGDSPGGIAKGLKRVWDNTGMSAVANSTGGKLVVFESGEVRRVMVENREYYLSGCAFDFDFVISLPKLKTHVLTNYTGALKNCYGFIPGLRKSDYHKENPDVQSFSRVVVDVYSIVRPGLTIMDAGLAMEGDGPASGQPRWLGYLFAAVDGVALDSAVMSLLDPGRRRVWPTEIAAERGLGTADPGGIERAGPAFAGGDISDFKMPSNAYLRFIPSFLVKALEPYLWVRPAVNSETCTMCNICVINCPQDVISEKEGRLRFDYDKCIKCMCCHELCPHRSVYLEKSLLARLIG